ncbi:hypothetical protein KY317_00560 [Candidatus Woesearchaeota archaeon]|nr:hypothetical protein [Candidatus Woesearchaeota archaeon]
MDKINITYETLFELLRREKTREALQKLDSSFFDDVVNYLKEKKASFEELKNKTDLFAVEEKKKTEKQHENTRKIIKEFYERRERKILNMAVDASRTFSSVIDTTAMLEKERLFFDNLVETLNIFRTGVLFNVMEARMPEIMQKKQENTENPEQKPEISETTEKKDKLIRFRHAVPRFFGENLEEYGPFEKEDIAKIPSVIADILIEKQRAEEMKEN